MCGCNNIIDGVETFQRVFKKFVSFDSITIIDKKYATCMATIGFIFILQILSNAYVIKQISILGNALKVCVVKLEGLQTSSGK